MEIEEGWRLGGENPKMEGKVVHFRQGEAVINSRG